MCFSYRIYSNLKLEATLVIHYTTQENIDQDNDSLNTCFLSSPSSPPTSQTQAPSSAPSPNSQKIVLY